MKDYKKILEGIVNIISNTEKSEIISNICSYIDENCPELKGSGDERIKKAIHIYLDWLDGRKDYAPKGEYSIRDMIAWLEKQGQMDKASYEIAEKEKYDFVSGQYIECRKSFNEFKEDNSYWLEYIGNDTYIGRSDNILNQKFHITPKQLFCLFTQQHCPKENSVNEETNAPTEYGKYVDECLNEAAKHFFSDGEDKYSVADLFYAGVRCGESWLEKQSKDKPDFRERYKKMTESEWFKKTYEDKSCGIGSVLVDEAADETITIPDGYVATIEGNKVHIKREGKSAFEAINEKPVDKDIKIEPRFHKGEWVVNSSGEIAYIAEVKSDYYGTLRYYLEWVNGRKSDPTPGFIDNDFHLWNIEEDARDGDVLTSHECYVVFKEIDGLNIKCYFTYHLNVGSIPAFYVDTLQNKTAFCPVSKEECKILFKKINEFGYKWDSENKKLIKI